MSRLKLLEIGIGRALVHILSPQVWTVLWVIKHRAVTLVFEKCAHLSLCEDLLAEIIRPSVTKTKFYCLAINSAASPWSDRINQNCPVPRTSLGSGICPPPRDSTLLCL